MRWVVCMRPLSGPSMLGMFALPATHRNTSPTLHPDTCYFSIDGMGDGGQKRNTAVGLDQFNLEIMCLLL